MGRILLFVSNLTKRIEKELYRQNFGLKGDFLFPLLLQKGGVRFRIFVHVGS